MFIIIVIIRVLSVPADRGILAQYKQRPLWAELCRGQWTPMLRSVSTNSSLRCEKTILLYRHKHVYYYCSTVVPTACVPTGVLGFALLSVLVRTLCVPYPWRYNNRRDVCQWLHGMNSPCYPTWRLFAIDHPPSRVICFCHKA